MRLTHYARRAATLPPRETLRRARALWRRQTDARRTRAAEHANPTYALDLDEAALALVPRLSPLPATLLRDGVDARAARTAAAHDHVFDLLGSGPSRVTPGMACAGLGGIVFPPAAPDAIAAADAPTPANAPESRRIREMIEPGYAPIDWQRDFKSGFRWVARTWWRDIDYGDVRGADVKMPWELGRLQHLPVLALQFAARGADAEACRRAFRNQVLDFLAANPPRFGVQWACPMDVAIRAANLAIAWDLFRAHGATFDAPFEHVLARALYEHGRFLIAYPEWLPDARSNHFLCGIGGLAICAAYLPASAETDGWLAYAAGALAAELPRQFHPDGGNYEDSTAYHRLSGEAAVFAVATLAGMRGRVAAALDRVQPSLADTPGWTEYRAGGTPFAPALGDRFAAIARFTRAIARPDGLVPDIGDNDSGRFVALGETSRDHSHLVAAIDALFEGDTHGLDGTVVRALAGGPIYGIAPPAPPAATPRRFPDFGLYIYEVGRVWLAIRCGALAGGGYGAHLHNDQLSFELAVDGAAFFVDCGAYLYTPLPEARNRFRSAAMHNTLAIAGREQFQPGSASLFHLVDTARPRALEVGPDVFVGEHQGYGAPCRRSFRIAPDEIGVVESCTAPGAKSVSLHLHPEVRVAATTDGAMTLSRGSTRLAVTADEGAWRVEPSEIATGYGRLAPTQRLVLPVAGDRAAWRIRFES